MSLPHIIALFALSWISGGIPRHPGAEELIKLGNEAGGRDEYDKGINFYCAALRAGLSPEKTAEVRNERGLLYTEKGAYEKAIGDFTEALRLDPDSTDALLDRGVAFHLKGDTAHAIEDYTGAISRTPEDTDAYFKRGMAYYGKGDHDKAVADYRKIAALNQKVIDGHAKNAGDDADGDAADFLEAINNQAWLLATCPEDSVRNGARAVEYARKACELSRWKDPSIIDTLAAAFAESGDFTSATKYQAWYTGLRPDDKEGPGRLELYKAGKAYRETKP